FVISARISSRSAANKFVATSRRRAMVVAIVFFMAAMLLQRRNRLFFNRHRQLLVSQRTSALAPALLSSRNTINREKSHACNDQRDRHDVRRSPQRFGASR